MPPKSNEVCLTKEQIHKLCELYQTETDLWNMSSKNYHKKDVRTSALERIKEELMNEFEDLQITGEQIWVKLVNIRCYYRKELAKVTSSQKSGASTDEIYESSWAHFGILDKFLRSQIVQRKSITNLDESLEEDYDENSSQVTEVDVTPTRLLNKKRKLSGTDAMLAEAVSVLSDLRSQPSRDADMRKDDDADIFGKHVANELRKITDQRALGLVKIRIQNSLFEAQNGIGLYQPMVPLGSQSQHWTNTGDANGQQSAQNTFYSSSSRGGFY